MCPPLVCSSTNAVTVTVTATNVVKELQERAPVRFGILRYHAPWTATNEVLSVSRRFMAGMLSPREKCHTVLPTNKGDEFSFGKY